MKCCRDYPPKKITPHQRAGTQKISQKELNFDVVDSFSNSLTFLATGL
jgi:hypothetical protein